ncbi:MAG: serine hydrolase [Gemmatimonadota bacterium]|nr:MAG: serine hydrolase [Gemmatimonadota bacterium]
MGRRLVAATLLAESDTNWVTRRIWYMVGGVRCGALAVVSLDQNSRLREVNHPDMLAPTMTSVPSSLGLSLASAVVAVACYADLPGPDLNSPPSIEILSPVQGAVVNTGDTVRIVAQVTDPDGSVADVRFFVDGARRDTDVSPPYEFSWNTSDVVTRDHEIVIVACDDHGAVSDAAVQIRVDWVYQQPEQAQDGWTTASLHGSDVDLEPIRRLMERLRSLPDTLVHGVLIVKDGKLVLEEYFKGRRYTNPESEPTAPIIRFNRETTHNIASITKTVTSALLGIAIDRGIIDSVEQRAADFFPEVDAFDSEDKNSITLEHLVTMSSGLQWDQRTYHLLDPRNDIVPFYSAADPVSFYVGRPLVSNPGSTFVYSDASINVVARAIERASGMLIDRFARQYLFDPLGVGTAKWLTIRDGFVWASGNLEVTPRTMAKIGQLFLDGGIWNGERIISEEWVDRSTSPYHSVDQGWNYGYWNYGYGYAWWLVGFDRQSVRCFSGAGLGGQQIYVFPEQNAVVVLTGGHYWIPAITEPEHIMDQYIVPALQ